MFFILSKVTGFLLMPLSWILLALLLSFWLKKKLWRKRLRLSALLMLIFFTNPAISNWVMKQWEVAPVAIASLPNGLPLGVVLSGVTNPIQVPEDRTHFNKGADRLLHAIQLYHEGKIKNLLISGGSGLLTRQDVSESRGLERVALMAGVKREHLFVESASRNTRENAIFSKEIIAKNWPDEPFVLITSAFHMRRSLGCFEKAGLSPISFSADFYSVPWEWNNPLGLVVPSAESLIAWNILVREWVGILSYKVMGYI